MGKDQTWKHIDVFSHNCKITGSISRVCNFHVSGDTTLEDYTTGQTDYIGLAGTEINVVPTTISGSAQTADIVIQHSTCVEGPFIAIHLKDNNPTTIYHNGIFNVVDPDA